MVFTVFIFIDKLKIKIKIFHSQSKIEKYATNVNTFLFVFLPISLIINYFNLNKTIKTLFLGIFSGYFYFVDNGYLIIILIFLSILMNLQ